jgi:outer membrane protein OmpU
VAARFTHKVHGISLAVGGAYTQSFDKEFNPNDIDEATDANAYLRVAIGDFTVGAATEYRRNFGTTSADQWVIGAGATYNWDAWSVGLGWTRGTYESVVGANGVGPFNAVHDNFALTASYALGPGLWLDGVAEYSNYKSNDAAGPDYQGLGIGIGTQIVF